MTEKRCEHCEELLYEDEGMETVGRCANIECLACNEPQDLQE